MYKKVDRYRSYIIERAKEHSIIHFYIHLLINTLYNRKKNDIQPKSIPYFIHFISFHLYSPIYLHFGVLVYKHCTRTDFRENLYLVHFFAQFSTCHHHWYFSLLTYLEMVFETRFYQHHNAIYILSPPRLPLG